MNVMIVSEPGVNGVFRYVEALCDFLITRGVVVHLAYSDVRGSDLLEVLVKRVEAAGGTSLNLRVSNRPAVGDIHALCQLWSYARRIRPDVIHSHSSKAGALARVLPLFGIGSKQLYHPHAYRGMQPNPGRLVHLYNLAEAFLGLTGSTINISEDERSFALNRLRIGEDRSLLIPNGVDCARFHPVDLMRKKALREKFNLPPDGLILGTICRCSEQKDPLTLYRAFAATLSSIPETYLFHIGEGELDGEIELLIDRLGLRNRVFRRPYLQNPAEAYQAMDGFILTSRYEGFSLAALEALATNLPVIISEAPGNTDILRLPLSHLWKSPRGDVEGFAENIRAWYAAQQSFIPANHARVVEKAFDSRNVFQRVYDCYQGVTEMRRTGRFAEPGVRARANASLTFAQVWPALLLTAGGCGLIAAIGLTLKASGNIYFLRSISERLAFWVNDHGQLRNLFAYALLATPFVLWESRFHARLLLVLGLSAFAAALECLQLFIPTRWFELTDIAYSVIGIFSTWAFIELFDRSKRDRALFLSRERTSVAGKQAKP